MSHETTSKSDLEISAYKFIQEIEKTRMESKIIHSNDIQLAKKLISCVEIVFNNLQEEVVEFKKRFE